MRSPRPARLDFACLRWAAAVLGAAAFCRPPAPRPGDALFGRDKALHFAASAGIARGGYGGTALFTADRPVRLVTGGGLALAAGIAKEISDRYTGGDPSWRDLG